jgi:hypothetical protein
MVVRDEGTSSGGFGPLNIYLMIPWTVLMGNELPEILAKWFKRMMTERSGQTGGFRFDPNHFQNRLPPPFVRVKSDRPRGRWLS